MSHPSRPRILVVLVLLLLLLIFSLAVASVYADPIKPVSPDETNVARFWWRWFKPRTIEEIKSLGIVTFPSGTRDEGGYIFKDTLVGGLSAITYDNRRGVYYVLSDDKSEHDPSRFYTVDIDISDGSLDDGDVTFVDVTFLRDQKGNLYELDAIDPEGINLLTPGQLFISSEGDSGPPIDPAVGRYNRQGKLNRALPVPGKFLYSMDDSNHVRDNLAFESLTSTPNRRYLVTATENALENDGPKSTLTNGSPSRVLLYDARKKRPRQEFIYCVDPIPKEPDPPGAFADHGLVEMIALDNWGTLLSMERSFAVGVGNTILLYETSTRGAKDVSGATALNLDGCQPTDQGVMNKKFVADFETNLGVVPDNLEGMTFGPSLGHGWKLLIVVSDNNFNDNQTTQFIALAVKLGYANHP